MRFFVTDQAVATDCRVELDLQFHVFGDGVENSAAEFRRPAPS